MSDRDYGVNAESPAGIIAVILDSAPAATEIITELNDLGFVIVKRDWLTQVQQDSLAK